MKGGPPSRIHYLPAPQAEVCSFWTIFIDLLNHHQPLCLDGCHRRRWEGQRWCLGSRPLQNISTAQWECFSTHFHPPNTGPHTSSELFGEGLGGEANLVFLFRFTPQNFIYFQYLVPTVRVPINGERPEGKENREGGERGWFRIYLYWKCINIHSVKGNTFN